MEKKQNASLTLAQMRELTGLSIEGIPGERPLSPHPTPKGKKTLGRRIWQVQEVYLLMVPGILYFVCFYYLPLLGNIVAFQNYSPYLGFLASPWVGIQNFIDLLTAADFLVVIRNTLVINALQIIFAFPLGLVLALLLNSIVSERFKQAMQSVVYLPHFLGWVIIVSVWREIFAGDGLVNHLITGLGGKPVDIITNTAFFQPMMVVQVIWKESGWSTVMFLAALSAIDLHLYEAAVVDGANKWYRLWHVTFPGIKNIVALLLILRLGSILNTGFEQIFLQQDGVSSSVSQVLDTYVYFRGIVQGQWGLAAAAGLLKAVVGIILIYAANQAAKKLGGEGLF